MSLMAPAAAKYGWGRHDEKEASVTPAEALRQLYAARNALRQHFDGLPFTLDGRMVGDIGEAIAVSHWGLTRLPEGSKTHDVKTKSGKLIQIKTTQQTRGGAGVGLGLDKQSFDHLIVIQIAEDASYSVLYDGPGRYVDEKRDGKKSASLTVNQLRELDKAVPARARVLRKAQRQGTL